MYTMAEMQEAPEYAVRPSYVCTDNYTEFGGGSQEPAGEATNPDKMRGTLGLPVLMRYSEAWTNSCTAPGQFKLSYICTAASL